MKQIVGEISNECWRAKSTRKGPGKSFFHNVKESKLVGTSGIRSLRRAPTFEKIFFGEVGEFFFAPNLT